MKSRLNFRDLEYKDGPHRICIFEVIDSQNILRWMSKKSRFRRCFDKQDGKVHKHCCNVHRSTLIIFTGYWKRNCVRKILSYWHAKAWEFLLTHWLAMKRILFLIETPWGYQCRSNYLKNKNFFLIFCCIFEI